MRRNSYALVKSNLNKYLGGSKLAKRIIALVTALFLFVPTLSFASELENNVQPTNQAPEAEAEANVDVVGNEETITEEEISEETTESAVTPTEGVTSEVTPTEENTADEGVSVENPPLQEEPVTETPVAEENTEIDTTSDNTPVDNSINGWVYESGYIYYYENGAYLTGWQQIDGKTYYFESTGVALTGKVSIQSTVDLDYDFYFFSEETGEMQTGWVYTQDKWYYFNTDGTMKTGWVQSGNTWYYLTTQDDVIANDFSYGDVSQVEYGYMATGLYWVVNEESYYYFNKNSGARLANNWAFLYDQYYWVYATNDGKLATGWLLLDSKWYYFHSWGAMETGLLNLEDGSTYILDENGALVTQPGWYKRYGTWYYIKDQSGVLHKGWLHQGNKWYYLDEGFGNMHTGSSSIDGQTYFFNDNGEWAAGGWYSDGYDWFYLNADGSYRTGWLLDGSTWYYLDDEYGYMYTGLYEIDGKEYVFNNSGAWTSSPGWTNSGYNNWYYLKADGSVYHGWLQQGNVWYYLDEVYGYMHTGYSYIQDTPYFFNSDGSWKTSAGWGYDGYDWYYIKSDGSLFYGWLLENGKWYFLDEDYGYMHTGYEDIDGTAYFFNKDGSWKSNGGWARDEYDWYYLNGDGSVYHGWLLENGKWYYLDEEYGYMHYGYAHVLDTPYYFNADGSMRSNGWISETYDDSTYWFFATPNGELKTDQWHYEGSTRYYFDDYGFMVTGYYQIGSSVHYFNNDGVWMGEVLSY